MKNFGLYMETNIKYQEGKQLLQDYIEATETHVAWLKDMCNKFNNTLFDLSDFSGFNYWKAVVFIRTWEIINELPTDKKNLFLIYSACGYDYEKTLAVFNGIGRGCKNIATLRVLVSNTRKIIRKIYNEKYGTN